MDVLTLLFGLIVLVVILGIAYFALGIAIWYLVIGYPIVIFAVSLWAGYHIWTAGHDNIAAILVLVVGGWAFAMMAGQVRPKQQRVLDAVERFFNIEGF